MSLVRYGPLWKERHRVVGTATMATGSETLKENDIRYDICKQYLEKATLQSLVLHLKNGFGGAMWVTIFLNEGRNLNLRTGKAEDLSSHGKFSSLSHQ